MKKTDEIKIDKLILNIEGEKISLTIEQAKKLKQTLEELFQKEIIKEIIHEHHYDWWYRRNWYWDGTQDYNFNPPVTYCSSNNSIEMSV